MQFGPHVIAPSFVVYETALSYVFTNLRPSSEGHLLVAPKRCVQHLADLSAAEKEDLYATARLVGQTMHSCLNTDGWQATIQDGVACGQTVPHVHMHVIPRKVPTEWICSENQPDDLRSSLTEKYRKFFV